MRNGPWNVPRNCASVYDGLTVGSPVTEKGRASHAAFPSWMPLAYVYSDRCPGRFVPNARGCAKGVDAPLLTLPLISRPAAAPIPVGSAGASSGKLAGAVGACAT